VTLAAAASDQIDMGARVTAAIGDEITTGLELLDQDRSRKLGLATARRVSAFRPIYRGIDLGAPRERSMALSGAFLLPGAY
jgi:hypothetical protein